MFIKVIVSILFLMNILVASNSFGLAFLGTKNEYGKSSFLVVPNLKYEYKKILVSGINFSYKPNFFTELLLVPELKHYKANFIYKKRSLDIGFNLKYKLDSYFFKLQYLHDLLNVSNGNKTSFTTSAHLKNGKFFFIPSIGIKFQDSKYSNYYYSELNYTLKNTLNLLASLLSVYKINKNYSVSFINKIEYLDKDIRNSPLVNRSYSSSHILGLSYKF